MKIWFVVLLTLSLSSAVISAAASGTVTGQMVVNGKIVKLTHVYASAMPGRSDKKKVEIRVILSDVAISAEDLASSGNRETLATAGKLHAMELLLGDDPMGHPGKIALYNDIYDAAFNGAQQPMRLTGLDTFATKTDDGKTIAGRHSMASPHKFSADMGNGVTFQDDVTFSAPVEP
ncbi:MAG TPA: hypothetical protein VLC46_18895 [Thermoanaerobaculia bacterium]|nr:hypothetical protein [Thermoanaerobaculia bacterium]